MSPQPDQDIDRSVLSWESVLDASDTETNPQTDIAPADAPPDPPAPPVAARTPPLASGDANLAIAPAALDNANVLGDLHLEIPPLNLDATVAPAPPSPPPAPVVPAADVAAAVDDVIELTIAPLDLPDLTPSGRVPSVAPEAPTPTVSAGTPLAVAEAVSGTAAVAAVADETDRPPAGVAGLPNDAVSRDHSPTTVIAVHAAAPAAAAVAAVPAIPVPAIPVPGAPAQVPAPRLPGGQPDQSAAPRAAAASVAAPPSTEAGAVSRWDRKHQNKLKKHEQKAALKQAKAARARSGAGGVALFFTLLVLVGLIAGAIIFGRPYLFPDEWEDTARPYGEAVETARGAEFAEPITVQRRAADVYATSMATQIVGPWESELPTWRSFGLINGTVDAPLLSGLVEDWTAAYYSPTTGEVIANDAAGPQLLDAAIAEAMTAGALDQETGWSSSIDDALLDSPALTRAVVTASSRGAAAATSFGAAETIRDIAISAFLPPVIEYRANAPLAFAEFSTNDPAQRPADFEALRVASQLQLSSEPEVAVGDTLTSSQEMTDRTYWYLVFAGYTDAASAYAASNALVQVSLATVDSAGRHCNYATFSGTDVEGTSRVSWMLQQWVSSVPAEMTASLSTLATGTMQLRTCDPGVAFETLARFGVGREIARLRSVELAAVAAIPLVEGVTADRAAAIAEVRNSQLGLPLMELAFETSLAESAAQARALVAALAGIPLDQAE
jgi:hypothetical protein